ncbi:MAG: ribose-phosphate pyrophosphokinase [Bacteroidetes bacterium]|jgi:ribose-phosphate pyrophosphokinase|nr:ribose-phosphate pyrophosphokinase [Bacteroidota bacterium]MBK9523850.1 ribose-phosphate pyrophosphokinase [Bacteroidota bacterium]MBK9541593.1 ribose-phosphate pyrophosphokinase [Bacteroidota bacterium]MBL0258523.1 ribose-phosphate pyrophosphokinase [Bacteroidota bacterium]
MERNVKLFSGTATHYLAERIALGYGLPLGEVNVARFSDGEFSPSFDESVRGCDVFIIQSTFAPSDNLLELLLLIDAAKRASAHYITAVIPYFGFARSDRKDKPRVAIASKLVANLLSAAGVTRVITMDLHAPQIQGFFDIPVDHLEPSSLFVPYIESLQLPNLTIAAPDMGGVNRARGYAKYFNAEMVICDKHRKKANEIETMTVIGDVEGRDIILVDDICDTAGTLTKAAEMLFDKGASSVRAFCTHPVLSGKAYERIKNSRLTELVVTDTIPLKEECDKIKVISTAELFSRIIRRVYVYESISQLFLV